MIDITTTYLGLPMKSPIVARPLHSVSRWKTYGISKTPESVLSCCLHFLKNSSIWRATRLIPIFRAAARALRNRSTTCPTCIPTTSGPMAT